MRSATSGLPPHLRPFVLPHETVEPARSGALDLYLPASTPAPAVLMVHGGPVPRDHEVRPPDWPAYRGYGALLARAGLACGMFEHGFVDEKTLGTAQQNIRDAAAALRAHPRVDPDRFGMWFFSAGGLFMGSVLADPPAWGVAAVSGTYAAVAHPDVHDPGLPTATVTAELSDIPLLLVMPEYDFEWIVTARMELLERCATELTSTDDDCAGQITMSAPGGAVRPGDLADKSFRADEHDRLRGQFARGVGACRRQAVAQDGYRLASAGTFSDLPGMSTRRPVNEGGSAG